MSDEDSGIDLLPILWQSKLLIISLTFFGAVCGISLSFTRPKLYESTATVLFPSDVGLNLAGFSIPGLGGGSSAGQSAALNSLGISQGRNPTSDLAESVLQSRGAAAHVFDFFHLESKLKFPPGRDQAITAFKKRYVNITKKKNALTLSCQAPDPKTAREMVLEYLAYYKVYSNRAVLTTSKRHRIFVEGQLEKRIAARRDSEKKLIEFANTKGSQLLEASPDVRGKYIGDLMKVTMESEARTKSADARLAKVRELSDASSELASQNSLFPQSDDRLLENLQGQMVAARSELARLEVSKTDSHPEVVAARIKLQSVEEQIRKRLEVVISANKEGLTKDQVLAEADSVASRAAFENAQLQESLARKKLASAPEGLVTEKRLQVDLAVQQELERLLQVELARAKIKESLDSSELEVLDPPEEPSRQCSPKKSYFAIGGALLGAFLALLITFRTRLLEFKQTHLNKKVDEPSTAP